MVYATSWGVSTRLIGGVIMTHGDDKGLKLPPKIAPYQVVVVPIFRDENKQSIQDYLAPLLSELRSAGVRVHEDWRKDSPGFKFNEWEMKGVPLRLEVGPKDVESKQVVLVRRDNSEKQIIQKNKIAGLVPQFLDEIQKTLFESAKAFRSENTHTVTTYDEFKDVIANQGGFIRCGWDGTEKSEIAIREDTKATIRVIPFDENPKGLKCIYTGGPARHEVIFAKAY